jgi:hypothetical protein
MSEAVTEVWADPVVTRLKSGLRHRFGGKAPKPHAGDDPAAGDGSSCDLLLYRIQLARIGHLERMWQRAREARGEAMSAWVRASADLALVREGLNPGFDGDGAIAKARAKAQTTSVAPAVLRDHPIELMFKRGQLKPEWRCLFEMYHDLSEVAEGGSVGVVDLDKFRVQTGGRPQFKTAQLQAIQELEEGFKGPIRKKAGERAAAVFDVTHRFGRHINSVMSVKQLGADGRYGKRKTVGQLLQRAYEALADHWGITAAQARARYRREPGSESTIDIVSPLSEAERAEIERHEAERRAAEAAREAARYQEGKDHATELQKQRRAGAR